MYQGNNPAALTSQKMLLDSLNELLKEKEFKDISVSEICCHSGISRQTFYSLFGTKENILLYQLEHSPYTKQPQDEETSGMTLMEMCERYSKYVASNYKQLKMLMDNELMEIVYTQFYRAMSTCRQSYVDLDNEEREYASLYMSAGLCYLTQKYIKNHKKPDQAELTRISYKIMSGSIYRI
ncbi:TetR/AcrR family transcriptional regulator [Clostridium sp.]|uniref:TetR/AcrR family transcriptional regulator n=1 Tax=Clostridium sp. TaxID=1506 RepID=UPI002FC8CE66